MVILKFKPKKLGFQLLIECIYELKTTHDARDLDFRVFRNPTIDHPKYSCRILNLV